MKKMHNTISNTSPTHRQTPSPTISKLSLERPLLHVCASFPSLRVNEGSRALMVSSFDVGVRLRDERGPRPPLPSCSRCPDQFGTAGCRRLLLSQVEEPAPTRRSLPSSTRIPAGGGAVDFILSWEDFLVQNHIILCSNTKFSARERASSRPTTRIFVWCPYDKYAFASWKCEFVLPGRHFFRAQPRPSAQKNDSAPADAPPLSCRSAAQ